MTNHKISVARESNIVEGHVLDVARAPLLAALKRYSHQLYLKWNSKKLRGKGCWELRYKPELKSIRQGVCVDSPKGRIYRPGNIFDMGNFTLVVPKYIENSFENHVKDFEYLSYDILNWIKKHDCWDYGYKGKDIVKEAEYREAKFLDKEEEQAEAEKAYAIKQHRTLINDFRQYVLSGGNPYRLMDYWGKK